MVVEGYEVRSGILEKTNGFLHGARKICVIVFGEVDRFCKVLSAQQFDLLAEGRIVTHSRQRMNLELLVAGEFPKENLVVDRTPVETRH